MISSPLGEYLGTALKLGPLAKSEICTSMNGLEDKFLTQLAVMLSGVGEPVLQVIALFVGVGAVELLDLEDVL